MRREVRSVAPTGASDSERMIPRKPSHKGFKRSTKPMKRIGKVGKENAKHRKVYAKEWEDVDYCTLRYDGCFGTKDGHAHSLKRLNRTRPEQDVETIPACSPCHLDKLERMGVEKMAAEVRRVRKEFGLEVWE